MEKLSRPKKLREEMGRAATKSKKNKTKQIGVYTGPILRLRKKVLNSDRIRNSSCFEEGRKAFGEIISSPGRKRNFV